MDLFSLPHDSLGENRDPMIITSWWSLTGGGQQQYRAQESLGNLTPFLVWPGCGSNPHPTSLRMATQPWGHWAGGYSPVLFVTATVFALSIFLCTHCSLSVLASFFSSEVFFYNSSEKWALAWLHLTFLLKANGKGSCCLLWHPFSFIRPLCSSLLSD